MPLTPESYSRYACSLYYGCRLSWKEVAKVLTTLRGEATTSRAARSACSRFKLSNSYDPKTETCPTELNELVSKVKSGEEVKVSPPISLGTPPPDDAPPNPEQSSSFKVEGNEAVLIAIQGTPIKTLDDLIQSHEIDLEVWSVAGPVTHNAWTTPAYNRQDQTWTYFQNHQVKVPFVKRNPDPIYPQVQPITPHKIYAPAPPSPRKQDIVRQLFFGDLHVGFRKDLYTANLQEFHDRRAMDLLIQIAHYAQPDQLVLLGDGVDAAELSDKFPREPTLLGTLEPALVELYFWWASLRSVSSPSSDMYYLEGNHEQRLTRWLISHFPAVYNLRRADSLDLPPVLSFENLIALDALNVRWLSGYPQNELWLDHIRARHGDTARKNPGTTGWAILQDADGPEVYAHIHREEMVTKSVYHRGDRRVVRAFSPGCLCHTDGRVPGSSPDDYWSQGVIVRDVYPEAETSQETFIHIENGACIYDGKLFEAKDPLPRLRDAFPGYNW